VTRSLYRGLIALHPPAFQDKFGEELIWIFDLHDPELGPFALLVDCLVSLVRQRLLRSNVWAFGVSLLINWCLFHKLIGFFSLSLGKVIASLY
jgi:hypothetical protein